MNEKISIEKTGNENYLVTVEGRQTTVHEVTVKEDDYKRLTGGAVTPEELLKESFRFLLERESNTMILRRFDLMVIERYFPEYTSEIKRRLTDE
ncbi:MAG: hypothetical protein Kow00127_19560 [Bacteroidales bacterium]